MRTKIVKALLDADGYVSGEELSKSLGVSRAAVWKHIKALKEEGAVIEAHSRRGYRLLHSPDSLRPEYVKAYGLPNGVCYSWKEDVDSTNDEAKRAARDGAPDRSVFVTEHQTKGKGRLGRGWESHKGEAVEMTVLLRPGFPPAKAPVITFAAALGILRAVRRICHVQAEIKWPNDVVYQGKKLCGILTEMSADLDRVEFLVCGMGLNANQKKFAKEVENRAISLRMITGEKVDRPQLCAAMVEDVLFYCDRYIRKGMDAIFEEYCSHSVVVGKEVKVICGNDTFAGRCEGFSRDGAILVRIGEEQKQFYAGEVSIRGMHDYAGCRERVCIKEV
jgi:BirA family biotin operon repressor/biotin-[acetyl-CoA-carboxylase] ligase